MAIDLCRQLSGHILVGANSGPPPPLALFEVAQIPHAATKVSSYIADSKLICPTYCSTACSCCA